MADYNTLQGDVSRRSLGTKAVWSYHVITSLETGAVCWFTFEPLRQLGLIASLSHWVGWHSAYRASTSNLDLWLLSLLRSLAVTVLIHMAPKTVNRAKDDGTSTIHKRLRSGVRYTCIAVQLLLLTKASVMAVSSPDDLWPVTVQQPIRVDHFVGLFYMFACLFTVLLGSFIQCAIAVLIIRRRQSEYELAAELLTEASRNLEEPLLQSTDSSSRLSSKKSKAAIARETANNKTISRLITMALPDAPINFVALAAGCVAALGSALVPYYTGQVIDYASIDPDRSKFFDTCLRLVVVAALCGVFTGIRGGLFTLTMTRLNVRIRKQLFAALVQNEMGYYDTTKTGDISSRLSSDTTSVSDQISLNINVMMRSSTQAILVLVFMIAASWRLTTITFVLIPLVMAISSVYGKYYRMLSKMVRTELAEANAVAEEVLSSMSTVKAHAAQESANANYRDKLDSYFKLMVKEAIAYSAYAFLFTFLPSAVSASVLFYGGTLVLGGKMSPGALVSFMLYQQSLSGAFQSMADVLSALNAAVGAADKVLELMHRTPEISEGGSLIPASGCLMGRIEFQQVVFSYPSRPEAPVLKGLSLVIQPGEVVALVGPSGGGKSSVVKLVERFYLPLSGRVLLDDHDIGQYNNKWLRRQVALVSQEPILYARSIKRNILYGLEADDGLEPPSDAEIEAAAKQANAHDFIEGFPEAYETNCGEKGTQMSGGQKQRIAIARALVRKPRVLLLDEATSALDADSEAVVQEALDRIMSGRTTLVIAHRLSTVQHANKIVVIADGQVQEVGDHEGLLAAGGAYAALVRRQLQRTGSSMSLARAPSAVGQMLLGGGTEKTAMGGFTSSGAMEEE